MLLQFTIMHHSYKSKTHCYKYNNFLCKKKYYLHILLELLAECQFSIDMLEELVILQPLMYLGQCGVSMKYMVKTGSCVEEPIYQNSFRLLI